jgi:hypothetical protein
MKNLKLPAVFLLTLIISSCALFKGGKSSDAIVLNYSFPDGQEFVITTTGTSEINSEQMGQSINLTTKSSSRMNCVAKPSQQSGVNILEFSYTDLTQSMTGPMGDADTDFSSIINKKMSMNIDFKGECSDFKGLEDMEPITTSTGEQVDADVFKQGFEQMFFLLPAEPVKVGTTWSQDVSNETPYGGGVLKTSGVVNYTVIEIKKVDNLPCVIIESEGNIKTTGKFQQQGMDLELDRTAKSKGIASFAYTKGIFLNVEATSNTTGSVEVPAMNMSIPQEIIVNSSTKVIFQ